MFIPGKLYLRALSVTQTTYTPAMQNIQDSGEGNSGLQWIGRLVFTSAQLNSGLIFLRQKADWLYYYYNKKWFDCTIKTKEKSLCTFMSKKRITIKKKQKCFWSLVFCMKKWTKKPPNFRDIWISNNFCFRNKRSIVITCGWRAMHREITAMPWSQIVW